MLVETETYGIKAPLNETECRTSMFRHTQKIKLRPFNVVWGRCLRRSVTEARVLRAARHFI